MKSSLAIILAAVCAACLPACQNTTPEERAVYMGMTMEAYKLYLAAHPAKVQAAK